MPKTQTNRIAKVKTALGEDVFLFYQMTGTEQLSGLFEYQIDMLSEKVDIDMTKILGKDLTVKFDLGDGTFRFFNGLVTRFSQYGSLGDLIFYRAILHPKPWLLTRASNCRIMETDKSVPDIVKKILADHGYSDIEMHLGSSYTYPTREYCVQYRETDFNFISRLLEEEGIHYYFKHSEAKHTMVLCDSITGHETATGHESGVPYFIPDNNANREKQHIYQWDLTQEIQTGSYKLTDFDFEKPKSSLLSKSSIPGTHAEASKEMYDYPGGYILHDDGTHYVTTRMEERRAEYERIQAKGNARGVAVGNLFKLTDYPREDQNREYLVISSNLKIQNNEYLSGLAAGTMEEFECTYVVMDRQIDYRPPNTTSKPIVQGPQTAIVVGKSGEEIFTDKYGRVKVQFHWDIKGQNDEKSSCWVRVSQAWAGNKWGSIHIPRIGQEVIVDFLEGNPDRPIITGRVYNANQMPPYTLPDNKTQSGIKSRSSKEGGGENANEICFEDKKGEEKLSIHAEKDYELVVENNDTQTIGFDTKKDGNQTVKIYNDRTVSLDQGNDTLTVKKGNREVSIDQGNATLTVKTGKRTNTIQGDDTLTVKQGNRVSSVDMGNDTLTVKQGNRNIEIKMGNDSLKLGMGNLTTKLDLGKVSEEAMQSIEMKVGQNSIKIDQMGITIKGMMISIEGQVKVDVKGVMTTINGDAMLTLKGGMTMIN